MAKVIKGKNLSKRIRYPWDEWMDGSTRVITRGTDFTCTVESMRSALYARQNPAEGLTVVTSATDDPDSIEFQFERN